MEENKKINKTMLVKNHLEEYGSITSWEAINLYYATRLSGIIYNLRYKYNMDIETQLVEFVDAYGTKSMYAKYILHKVEEEEEKNKNDK